MDQSLDVYLKENRYEQPKEIFKMLAGLAGGSGLLDAGTRVADIGCAAGEFLYFLAKTHPGPRYAGWDVAPELVEKARAAVPEVEFHTGSVIDTGLIPRASLDVAFMSGVMSLCDDFRVVLDNVLRWTRPGGRVYIFEVFNPHPVDVFLRFRRGGNEASGGEGHWSILARQTVTECLDRAAGIESYRFIPFEMPFDLAPDPSDPVRTWTWKVDGRRLFTSGLSMLLNLEVLEIRLSGDGPPTTQPGAPAPPLPAR
jgi:SAM-dependent methyltransferase